MQSPLLDKLNKEQSEAVQTTSGPLLIMAGAGSGKTRVLTHRIAYLIEEEHVAPWSILAITFTNKAANEMRERLANLISYEDASSVWVSTFHSFALRVLRRDADKIGFGSNFSVIDASAQRTLIKHIINDLNLDSEVFEPKNILAAISNFKNDMTLPDEAKTLAGPSEYKKGTARVYAEYQNRLKQQQAMDFDDLINNAILLFKTSPETLHYYQRKFQYIHVDEYQDTNDSQYTLINLLAGGEFGSRNLTVVGDSDQSIYGWRGANINNILNFEKDYPESKTIMLEQNYRSTKTILDAANQVISNNDNRKDKNLWTNNDSGEKITYYRAGNETDEAFFVANSIAKMHDNGRPLDDFAILFRTNAQSRTFENQLNKMQIPYRMVNGTKFFDRKEILDIIAYLQLVANPDNDSAFERIINEPKRSLGATSIEKLRVFAASQNRSMFSAIDYIDDTTGLNSAAIGKLRKFVVMIDGFIGQSEFLDLTEFTKQIFDETGIRDQYATKNDLESQSRVENLDEFLSLTKEFDSSYVPEESETNNKLIDFLGTTSLSSDIDDMTENGQGVTLMTLHAAKGLEFPVVYLVGLEEGIFPSFRAIMESPEQIEEERRLAYVGITRAQEELFITNAVARLLFGKTQNNQPSRFIEEIDGSLLDRIGGYSRTGSNDLSSPKLTPFDNTVQYSARTTTGAQNEEWHVAQKVNHKKWGQGTIVSIKGEGDDMELNIAFPNQGIKTLLAAFAPITKVEE
ncbi:MAG: DNA helicase PcrA [Lactobacillaceae bacterium]|jgi:DNA helicase-2/ATP-dependent DNA helicase PcrA|nr:DNA helicase PcrA [Lactobacillaceae bacterium]